MKRLTGQFLLFQALSVSEKSYYNSANLCLSVRQFCPSISTETVRTMHFALGQCVARNPTMCRFVLSLYGYGQVIQLNDFVWCSLAFFANVVVGSTGIPPTVSQEKCIPQLIVRVDYRLTKNYTGYPKYIIVMIYNIIL